MKSKRAAMILVAALLIVLASCSSSDSAEEIGASVAESVMTAWATGDQTDIDAIYAEDVVMALDGTTIAENREEITSVIAGALGIGNTYEQIGPVAVFVAEDGDLYIGTVVEVVGAGHPAGDPVVGFYRVRDGRVIRHIFMDAEHF